MITGFMTRILAILLIFLNSAFAYGQRINKVIEIQNYDRMIIVDSYNNNYQRFIGVIYEIDLTTRPFLIYQKEKVYKGNPEKKLIDSVFRVREAMAFEFKGPFIPDKEKKLIGSTNDSLVYELVDHLNHPKRGLDFIDKIFNYYAIDSIWLSEKKDSLMSLYFDEKRRVKKKERIFVDDVFSDFSKFKAMAIKKIIQRTTSHYPEVYISFESENDSIGFYNEGQYIFLLPWVKDSTYVNYDPDISMIIGQLLPKQNFNINKKYLLPTKEFFIENVIEEIKFKSYFVKSK